MICLHHDTLAIERRFQKHAEDIQLISADNVSERGAGRLVVTYDVGQTAIVWDLFSGEQVSRFASYEPLMVASWMRNGNIAFGMPSFPLYNYGAHELQETRKGRSYYSNRPRVSISQLGPYSTPSQRWRRLQTAKPMQ